MELSIIQIGNSKGIRLNKSILDRYHFKDKVELVFEEGFIILKPVHRPREKWEYAFEAMRVNGDDELLIDDFFEDEWMEE